MNYDITPVNKNATEKAKALLSYLVDTAGKGKAEDILLFGR